MCGYTCVRVCTCMAVEKLCLGHEGSTCVATERLG